ncbi:MAG TPA: hypothetical protein ENJ95_20855 [Bacteroidetes bacterium]|nr:hypothetical protein [Bacteroidota bacterium]
MMNKLMLSCKAATELMEKKYRGELTFKEKMQLSFHTAMCGACRRYEEQSRFIERLFRSKQEGPAENAAKEEGAKELEEKILQRLNAQRE